MKAKSIFAVLCLSLTFYASAACGVVPLQREARIQRKREIKNAPVRYLALGDSTCIGVGATQGGYAARLLARIEKTHPGSQLFNHCESAAATRDVLQTQLADVSKFELDLITLGIGANDLIQGVKIEDFARNYAAIINEIKIHTNAHVVLMNIPDLSLAPAVPAYMRADARRYIVAFNQRIADIAARNELPLVDLFVRSEEFASHSEFFSKDGFHPLDAGYEFWAEMLLPDVDDALAMSHKPKKS
jgi:acyl-CoA thioesterase-1